MSTSTNGAPVEPDSSSVSGSNEIDYPTECKGDYMPHADCDKVRAINLSLPYAYFVRLWWINFF